MGYLYGSSVQGIQSFIFETNKLKEIVGASELVEQLSRTQILSGGETSLFDDYLAKIGVELSEDDFYRAAAGNIRLFLKDKDKIEKIVRGWPKFVSEKVPGVTLSQAVLEVSKFSGKKTGELEKKLKEARNRLPIPDELSPMVAIRARRTGKPAVDWEDEKKPRDRATRLKQEKGQTEAPQNLMEKILPDGALRNLENAKEHYPYDISDILTEGDETGWLAVIHADGNGLGRILQSLSTAPAESTEEQPMQKQKDFSKTLDQCTLNAVKKATGDIGFLDGIPGKGAYPFRPVVAGGDDLTIIIRADLAFDFTLSYLNAFNEKTREHNGIFGEDGLTACAGIAYMKASYPFHYAVQLAEELCGYAKKGLERTAGLAFHKIQDSFVDSYEDITKRELSPQIDLSFVYGPYSIEKAEILRKQVETIQKPYSPKSGIRKWLGLLYHDFEEANLWLERVKEITTENFSRDLNLDIAITEGKTHLYDVMSLASLIKSEEKDEEERNG